MQISPVGSSGYSIPNKQSSTNAKNSFDEYVSQAQNTAEANEIKKAGLLKSLFRHSNGNVITINDLKAELKEDKESFLSRTNKLFSDNGIDTSKEISLSTDTNGKIIVTNDHPDKAKIEKIFEEESDLANLFRKISGLDSLVRHSDVAIAFQKAYSKDPIAAVAQYAYLFNSTDSTLFNMVIGGKEK
ncbi:hypothetical protein L7E55_13425 [Pelotomaculum isophthalicicum JI]|uniref:Uncharacterized protein n=1 Tax=Pelotomaculum isophthalicicum JI TaxID=947010 RepID=A0A9X4JWK9_9FIRM|nr:hypothetical protein [Pelotomaculum isophthalicicum]MDF9409343.1 hypothetical protein [Pelotomaculum isophthalicicum JI]